MSKKPESLPVIFRAERSGEYKGTVTAFFPTLAGTRDLWTCTGYAHIGQHCIPSIDYYRSTRAATVEEAAPLLAELRQIYETGSEAVTLKPVRRWTRHHDAIRRASLES